MGESEVKFGDKLFVYGEYLQNLSDYDNPEFNSIIDDMNNIEIHGFVVDFLFTASLTVATPFSQVDMVDVSRKLSRHLPLPAGTRVWMPMQATTQRLEYFR